MTLSITLIRPRADRVDHSVVVALAGFTAFVAAGFAIFALHPERLAQMPEAAATYGLALAVLPQAHILVSIACLVALLLRHTGKAWLPAAIALYAVSLGAELLGTPAGVPFGAYRYTEQLGIKWFEHVPVLIPASWFTMAVPSFALATRWITRRPFWRITAASALLVSWDLALDPAMSGLMPYWVWEHPGRYYGMPLLNLVGWYVTALALMIVLDRLRVDRWLAVVPTLPLAGMYAAILALPVLMATAAGLWIPALLATAPFVGAALHSEFRYSRRRA